MKIKNLILYYDCLGVVTENDMHFDIATGISFSEITFTLSELGAFEQFSKEQLSKMLELPLTTIELFFNKRNHQKQKVKRQYYSQEITCSFCEVTFTLEPYSSRCINCHSDFELI